MGWSFGGDREKFTLAEMVEVFSWDRISLGGPVFDLDKLTWLNEKYIHELVVRAARRRADRLAAQPRLPDRRCCRSCASASRSSTSVIPATEYFFSGDLDYTPVLAEMTVPDVAAPAVGKALLALRRAVRGHATACEARCSRRSRARGARRTGWKTKHAFMLLRLAVTGRKASPPLFETMAVLGKEITRRRLRHAAQVLAKRSR